MTAYSNKAYSILLWLCSLTLLVGCSDTEKYAGNGPFGNSGEIILSTGQNASVDASRSSIGSFPNNGRIGVIAAYYHPNPDSISWKSYAEIFDMGATAVLASGNSYTFSWDSPRYWPFDDKQLVFLAYSPPISEAADSLFIDAEGNKVLLRLYDGMPDFMYASANSAANTTPYSKSLQQAVNLGEFQHVLSKLTVEVVADPAMNPDVQLNNLSVTTSKRVAVLYLTENRLSEPTEEEHIYNLVSETTPLTIADTIRSSVLLFPGTEDVTEISIGLLDNTVYVSHDFMMSFFQNVTNVGQPLLLERGKNTTLRIIVKGTTITNVEIELKGVLSDWNVQGNFGITIN